MSNLTNQILEASTNHFQDCRERYINKALQYDAYDILDGTETGPTFSPNSAAEEKKAIRKFESCRSKIVGYICDTLDARQHTSGKI